MLVTSVAALLALGGGDAPLRAEPVGEAPECAGVLWTRSAEVSFCTTSCTSDIDCATGERCRVIDDHATPDVFADDVQADFVAAQEEAALAETEPLVDDDPECDEDCAPYSGDLEIKPAAPLAVCDPFHDVEGALLSSDDEAAIAVAE